MLIYIYTIYTVLITRVSSSLLYYRYMTCRVPDEINTIHFNTIHYAFTRKSGSGGTEIRVDNFVKMYRRETRAHQSFVIEPC